MHDVGTTIFVSSGSSASRRLPCEVQRRRRPPKSLPKFATREEMEMENKVGDIELCNFRVQLVFSEDVKYDKLFQFFYKLFAMYRVKICSVKNYYSQRNRKKFNSLEPKVLREIISIVSYSRAAFIITRHWNLIL